MMAIPVTVEEYRSIRDGGQRHLFIEGDIPGMLETVRLDCRDGRTMLVRITGMAKLGYLTTGHRAIVHVEPNADYVRRWEDE